MPTWNPPPAIPDLIAAFSFFGARHRPGYPPTTAPERRARIQAFARSARIVIQTKKENQA